MENKEIVRKVFQNYNIDIVRLSAVCFLFTVFFRIDNVSSFAQTRSKILPKSKTDDLVELTSGRQIRHKISDDEIQSFRIRLALGQFINLSVDEIQCNLILELKSGSGESLKKIESTPSRWNRSELLYLAVKNDDYILSVKSSNGQKIDGTYVLRIEELKSAGEIEKLRLKVDETYQEAYFSDEQEQAETSNKALKLYKSLLESYRKLNNLPAQAVVLYRLGWLERDAFGQLPEALEHFKQSFALWREIGDRAGQAQLLDFIGATRAQLGDFQGGADEHLEALKIWREINIPASEGYALGELGFVSGKLSDFQKALDYYNEAMKIYRAIGNESDAARTLSNIGGIYDVLGDPKKSIEYNERALATQRRINDRSGQPGTLSNIGAAYNKLGDSAGSLEYYSRALKLAREIGLPQKEAGAMTQIAGIYLERGNLPDAEKFSVQALDIFRRLNALEGEIQASNLLGNIRADKNEPLKAVGYFKEAVTISRRIKSRRLEAESLFFLASVERSSGNLTDALSHIEESIALLEQTRKQLIEPDFRTGYFGTVQDYYFLRTEILMQLREEFPSENYESLAFESNEKYRARTLLDLLIESRADIRQGIDADLLEREKSVQNRLSAKLNYQIKLLAGKHTTEQAESADNEIKILNEEYETVETEIRVKSPRYAALTQGATVSAREIQAGILDSETILLEYALGKEKSFLWMVGKNSVTSYELPKRAEIEAAARRVYEILTVRNRNLKGETETAKQMRVAQAEKEFGEASAGLSRMIFAPVASRIGAKRLLIVADGALQYVPFASLPIEAKMLNSQSEIARHFLIETNEIVNLPSASTLAVLRQEKRNAEPVDNSVAIVADPVFSRSDPRVSESGKKRKTEPFSNVPAAAMRNADLANRAASVERAARESGLDSFPRLRFSRDEAEAIAAIAPRANLIEAVDFAANKRIVTSADFARRRIVHFATHGLINSQNPRLSGIVLSLVDEKGEAEDGFLRLFEIYNLKLDSDLVVLSACRTALGEDVRGEGLIGLTRGFMYAGSPRVAASLWSIDDRATAELMKKFYIAMLREKMPAAKALRAAQIEMLKSARFNSPYYWAAFTLQGDWR